MFEHPRGRCTHCWKMFNCMYVCAFFHCFCAPAWGSCSVLLYCLVLFVTSQCCLRESWWSWSFFNSFQFLIHIHILLNWSKTKKHLKRIFDDVLRITNRNDCEKYEWKTRLKTDNFLRLSTATNCQTQMCSNCRDLQISPELGVDFI